MSPPGIRPASEDAASNSVSFNGEPLARLSDVRSLELHRFWMRTAHGGRMAYNMDLMFGPGRGTTQANGDLPEMNALAEGIAGFLGVEAVPA